MRTNNVKTDWDDYFGSWMYPSKTGWHQSELVLYRKWYSSWLTYIHKLVPIYQKGITAFEIGGGIGAVASFFPENGVRITGSDISKKAVSIAKSLNPKIPFVVCNIEKGIPGNNKYDRIFAFEVLEHLDDIPSAIDHIKKHLTKKGYFIGTSPYPYPRNMLDPTHIHVMYPEYWLKIFKEHGFTDVSVRPLSCLPFLWKIHEKLHPILPFYIPFKYFVSTTLIIARLP
jgi:2-polyprenyl-3-methyl-5-hydroxy-6-metoxy-1,4-benzoquinol methylase